MSRKIWPCRVCGETFVLTSSQIKNYKYLCNPCRRKAYVEMEATKKYFKEYMKNPVTKSHYAESARERLKNPVTRHRKQVAYILHNAIRSGEIKRLPCGVCGEEPADGHHDDYSKPLEVQWLCRKHHGEHHAMMRERTI